MDTRLRVTAAIPEAGTTVESHVVCGGAHDLWASVGVQMQV